MVWKCIQILWGSEGGFNAREYGTKSFFWGLEFCVGIKLQMQEDTTQKVSVISQDCHFNVPSSYSAMWGYLFSSEPLPLLICNLGRDSKGLVQR